MRTRFTILFVGFVAALSFAASAQSGPAETMLEAARKKEVVDGDLNGAIKEYQEIVARYQNTDRATTATALLRTAEAYEKLGNAQARNVYERIIAQFADQTAVVSTARARLGRAGAAQGVPPSAGASGAKVLCKNCGGIFDGSVSQDGRWLATTDYSTGDIQVRDLSTGQIARVNAKPGGYPPAGSPPAGDQDWTAFGPVLSPDGQHIAYVWMGPPQRIRELRVIARDGRTGPRNLVTNPEFRSPAPAAWSRDGRQVLAVLEKPDQTTQIAWVSTVDGRVTVLTSLGERLAPRGTHRPAISPDGRFIAYAALPQSASLPQPAAPESTNQRLYVLAADGSSETEVTATTEAIDASPVWAPDGSALLFHSNRTGTWDLWTLPMREGRAAGAPSIVNRNLLGVPVALLDSGVLLSEDGTSQVDQIIIADLDVNGGLPQQARVTDTLTGSRPSWSPDTKILQFTSAFLGATTNFDIILRAMDTGREERRMPSNGARRPAEWRRNGTFLTVANPGSRQPGMASTGAGANVRAFYAVDPGSGTSREVVRTETRAAVAALSPDETTLFQFGRHPERAGVANRIVAVDIATGRERVVHALAGEVATLPSIPGGIDLALSRDGRALAFLVCTPPVFGANHPGFGLAVTGGGDCQLNRLNVDGTGYRTLIGSFKGLTVGDRLAWTSDGSGILFASREGASDDCWVLSCQLRMMRVSADGGSPSFTGLEMNLGTGGIFSVSANGSRVAFDTTVPGSSDLVALDLSPVLKRR